MNSLHKELMEQSSRRAAWSAKILKLAEDARRDMKELNEMPLWFDGTRKDTENEHI